ncbi:cysteine desulfurase [Hanamia caeni]|uniref:cysteine desulfurase n=1 Tax=Hanamia caeni TaxID=2294116 RepID=A0A3M9NSC6_9BACT|nr:cysteine desulfurase family protein [Hanamia caeni]RNI39958.1 cysteine desulfurase [Hanamia caeni]
MQRIYFDNAATTPLDPEVFEAMLPYFTEKFGNPSSIYSYGRETRMAIENARKTVAKILNAHPSEIFFTSGGTESTNTAIHAAVNDLGCMHIISSPLEHHATLHSIEHLAAKGKIKLSYVNILPNGLIDYEDLERLLMECNEKCLVTLMHANNEIGNMTDIERVSDLAKKYDAILNVDTVQTVGHFPIDLQKLHVHFINAAAHKFHGPKGVGMLYINRDIKIHPLINGGSQERNMRAGTENIYGIVGLAKALQMAVDNMEKESRHILEVKNYMKEQLLKNIPGVRFNGNQDGKCLYTVLSVAFPRTEKSDMLLFNLDINNICASGGSACTSGVEAVSHVIKTISPESDQATVRFSFSKFNTKEEVDVVVNKLKEIM